MCMDDLLQVQQGLSVVGRLRCGVVQEVAWCITRFRWVAFCREIRNIISGIALRVFREYPPMKNTQCHLARGRYFGRQNRSALHDTVPVRPQERIHMRLA